MQHATFTYLLLIILIACSCTKASQQQQQVPPIKVEVQVISKQTITPTHTYVATIKEPVSIPLSIPAGGTITKIRVKNGDAVKANQVLLETDTTQASNALQIAKATLTQAQDGYQRAKQVFQQGGVTEQKMVELKSQLQQATSMFTLAQKRLNDCILKAPQSGVIGDINLHVGQNIAPAIPVITLLNIDSYHVCFDVAEQDISTLQVGDKGYLLMDVIQSDTLAIRIIEKKLLANSIAHTYTVTASIESLTDQQKQQILPGMIGKAYLAPQMLQGIVLPTNCIQTQTNGNTVWLYKNGEAYRQQVQVGNYTASGVLITQGLAEGDSVIVSGYQKLYHQAAVVVQ